MESLASILPNLSIGVVSILLTAFITVNFIRSLREQADKHSQHISDMQTAHQVAMNEREDSMRKLEKEIRETLILNLSRSAQTMDRNVQVLERVIDYLKK